MHDLIQLGPGMSPDQASFGTEDGSCGYGLLQARFRACLTSIRFFCGCVGRASSTPIPALGPAQRFRPLCRPGALLNGSAPVQFQLLGGATWSARWATASECTFLDLCNSRNCAHRFPEMCTPMQFLIETKRSCRAAGVDR